jgi:polar amino acid transport system substrate-binding protein
VNARKTSQVYAQAPFHPFRTNGSSIVVFRKLSAVLVAGVLVAGLAACGDDDEETTDTTTAPAGTGGDTSAPATGAPAGDFTPVTEDTLTVVTSLPGPGFWNGDDPESIDGGFEFEMAKAIQAELGLANLEVRNENFDSIVTGAVTDYDIALSQVTITDERAEVVDFSEPYFESQQGILVNAGTTVETVDDAKALKWAVQTGTTGEILVTTKLLPTEEAQPFQDLSAAFAALQAGQVDAVAMDTAIVLGQAANSGGALEVAAQFAQPDGPDQYGAIYPKGSPNKPTLDAIIAGLEEDGSLATFGEEWLTVDPGDITTIELG